MNVDTGEGDETRIEATRKRLMPICGNLRKNHNKNAEPRKQLAENALIIHKN
jgi:hypothetical protein